MATAFLINALKDKELATEISDFGTGLGFYFDTAH